MVPKTPPGNGAIWAAIIVPVACLLIGGGFTLSKDTGAKDVQLSSLAASVQGNQKSIEKLIESDAKNKERQAETAQNVAVMATEITNISAMMRDEHEHSRRRHVK